jgi:hypothetical protein
MTIVKDFTLPPVIAADAAATIDSSQSDYPATPEESRIVVTVRRSLYPNSTIAAIGTELPRLATLSGQGQNNLASREVLTPCAIHQLCARISAIFQQ